MLGVFLSFCCLILSGLRFSLCAFQFWIKEQSRKSQVFVHGLANRLFVNRNDDSFPHKIFHINH